jgi:hypothetical protein
MDWLDLVEDILTSRTYQLSTCKTNAKKDFSRKIGRNEISLYTYG